MRRALSLEAAPIFRLTILISIWRLLPVASADFKLFLHYVAFRGNRRVSSAGKESNPLAPVSAVFPGFAAIALLAARASLRISGCCLCLPLRAAPAFLLFIWVSPPPSPLLCPPRAPFRQGGLTRFLPGGRAAATRPASIACFVRDTDQAEQADTNAKHHHEP